MFPWSTRAARRPRRERYRSRAADGLACIGLYVPCGMARSLVFGHFSLIRIRLAGECLFSCTRATSSSLARLLSRNTKCIEFSASTFMVEFKLTSITCCNSVLSLCDNFRCHYQWPTCRLTVLTKSLAKLYILKRLLSSDPTFLASNK